METWIRERDSCAYRCGERVRREQEREEREERGDVDSVGSLIACGVDKCGAS